MPKVTVIDRAWTPQMADTRTNLFATAAPFFGNLYRDYFYCLVFHLIFLFLEIQITFILQNLVCLTINADLNRTTHRYITQFISNTRYTNLARLSLACPIFIREIQIFGFFKNVKRGIIR